MNGQADAMEIEITPEMIEAGAHALALFDTDYSSNEEGVETILDAMFMDSGTKLILAPQTFHEMPL